MGVNFSRTGDNEVDPKLQQYQEIKITQQIIEQAWREVDMSGGDGIKVPPRKVQKTSRNQQPGLVERLDQLSITDNKRKKSLYQAPPPPQIQRSTQSTQPTEFQFQTELRSQRRKVKRKEPKREEGQEGYVGFQEQCNKFWNQSHNSGNEASFVHNSQQRQDAKSQNQQQIKHKSEDKEVVRQFKARELDRRIFDNKLWGMMGVPFKAVAHTTQTQPFSFATTARSQIPRQQHHTDANMVDIQQVSEQPHKASRCQKDNFQLHSQKRAEKRRLFRQIVEKKRLQEQQKQQQKAAEAAIEEKRLLSAYRQQIEFKASPMPDLSQPDFVPDYSSSQPPTVPHQPSLGRKSVKRRNDSYEYLELQNIDYLLES